MDSAAVDGGREQAVRQHARRRTRTTHGKYAAVAAARPVAGIRTAVRSAYNAGATVLRPAVRRWVRRRVRRYAVAAASAAESSDRCRASAGRPCRAGRVFRRRHILLMLCYLVLRRRLHLRRDRFHPGQ